MGSYLSQLYHNTEDDIQDNVTADSQSNGTKPERGTGDIYREASGMSFVKTTLNLEGGHTSHGVTLTSFDQASDMGYYGAKVNVVGGQTIPSHLLNEYRSFTTTTGSAQDSQSDKPPAQMQSFRKAHDMEFIGAELNFVVGDRIVDTSRNASSAAWQSQTTPQGDESLGDRGEMVIYGQRGSRPSTRQVTAPGRRSQLALPAPGDQINPAITLTRRSEDHGESVYSYRPSRTVAV